MPRVLLVDDDVDLCESLAAEIVKLPARVECMHCGDHAITLLLREDQKDDPVKLVIMDMWVPRSMNEEIDSELGLVFLLDNAFYQLLPYGTPVIVFTCHETYDNCVKCMRAGAYDYLPKVAENQNNMQILLERCRELLYPHRKPDNVQRWLEKYWPTLVERFPGKCVALLEKTLAERAGLSLEILGNYMIAPKETRAEIARLMLDNEVLRWEKPHYVELPLRRG